MSLFKKKDYYYLGIDIGGTNVRFAVFNNSFDMIFSDSFETKSYEGKLLDKVITTTKNIQESHTISSIAVGVPGYVNNVGSVMISPNIPEFTDLPLKMKLESEFDIPIIVENDANVAAYAELSAGAGKDMKNFIYMTLGTGIGGSIVLNREIFKGNYGGAGEIGFLHITLNESKSFKSGSLESFAGREAILKTARSILEKYPDSILHSIDNFDVKDISEAVSNSDRASIEIFSRIGYYIGSGIASTFNLLDLNQAIIGGGISQAHTILFESIIETIQQRCLPTIAPYTEIYRSAFQENSGIIGAGYLAKSILNK